MLKKNLLIGAATAALCLGASNAQAAGFYIQEQSVKGLGSAFSGSVANLHDPSTIYFNPAGMVHLEGTQVQGGVHLLVPNSQLTDTGSTTPQVGTPISGGDGGNPYNPTPVPNGFISHQINDNVWVGASFAAPFGLANRYDSDWFGRYDSIETELTVIDLQPTVAYKVGDWFSLGAGLNIQHADAKLTQAAFGTTEGLSSLEGKDTSYGYTVGFQLKPWDSMRLGANYRSAVSHELEGRVVTTGTTGGDFAVAGRADLDLPDIATFGFAQDLGDRWTVQGQATWFGWNNFESITPITDSAFTLGLGPSRAEGEAIGSTIQNYQTTWAFAVGAEYMWDNEWTFRGGLQFDETPTTDEYRTSRTPDGDRTWVSGGASYKINNSVELDMAATYIFIEDEEINVTRNNTFSSALAGQVEANTEGNVGIVAVGFTYKF